MARATRSKSPAPRKTAAKKAATPVRRSTRSTRGVKAEDDAFLTAISVPEEDVFSSEDEEIPSSGEETDQDADRVEITSDLDSEDLDDLDEDADLMWIPIPEESTHATKIALRTSYVYLYAEFLAFFVFFDRLAEHLPSGDRGAQMAVGLGALQLALLLSAAAQCGHDAQKKALQYTMVGDVVRVVVSISGGVGSAFARIDLMMRLGRILLSAWACYFYEDPVDDDEDSDEDDSEDDDYSSSDDDSESE